MEHRHTPEDRHGHLSPGLASDTHHKDHPLSPTPTKSLTRPIEKHQKESSIKSAEHTPADHPAPRKEAEQTAEDAVLEFETSHYQIHPHKSDDDDDDEDYENDFPKRETLAPAAGIRVSLLDDDDDTDDFADIKEKAMQLPDMDWDDLDDALASEETFSISGASEVSNEAEPYVPPTSGKFRALARVVMINLRWAKDLRKWDECRGFEVSGTCQLTGTRKSSYFRVTDFLANKRIISGLTGLEKDSLKLHPFGRKPHDIVIIMKVMDRYKCFEKFSHEVRHDLARWVRYDSFDDGRVLLRQGHEPYSMYFILTGSVNFKASDSDPRTGRTNYYPLGIRGPNSIIGEIELLNKDNRRSTGVTMGDVELLRVDEEPFDEILRNSFDTIWEERFAGLRSAQTFESWSDSELKILNDNSSLITFSENKVILSDVSGQSAFTYFIQKGRCAMVKDVILEKSNFGRKYPVFEALDANDERRWFSHAVIKRDETLDPHHLHITDFKEGDYFGAGEDLRRTHIITLTTVECLTIPRSVFEKTNRISFLDDLKADLDDAIPTDEQIVDEWLALRTWNKYKQTDLKEFYKKRDIAADNERFFDMHKRWR